MNRTVPRVADWLLCWSSSKGPSAMAVGLLFPNHCSRAVNWEPPGAGAVTLCLTGYLGRPFWRARKLLLRTG